jgi:hypothetical protein
MALIASRFAVLVAVGSAAAISGDYGEAPVRRMAKVHDEAARIQPVSLEEVAEDVVDDDEPVALGEVMSLTALHKDWPHCQVLREHNWGGMQGAEQHLKKMTVVPNVTSAKACGQLCGSYTYMHNGESLPCAGWAWVEKSWASEFGGFKNCAMFGFMENDAGAVRFPVSEYTYKNHCCTAGTPCKSGEVIDDYQPSADKIARAYRKAERARRGREKRERAAAARAAKIEAAKPHSSTHLVVLVVAAVLGLGVIGGVCAWKAGYAKQWS